MQSKTKDTHFESTSLPSTRAFLVQLQQNSGESGQGFAGRVEHVTSGCSIRFQSEEELINWIRQFLGEQQNSN